MDVGSSIGRLTDGMANANDGQRKVIAEDIDHLQQVPGVVEPAWVIALGAFIQHAASTAITGVSDPYRTYADAASSTDFEKVVPERLVSLLWKAEGSSTQYRNKRSILEGLLAVWYVLFGLEILRVFFAMPRSPGPLPEMLAGKYMRFDREF